MADILVFNKHSVTGEKSGLFWETVNGLSSVVETASNAPQNPSLLRLFSGLLKLYAAHRIGERAPQRQSAGVVHDEALAHGGGGVGENGGVTRASCIR